MVGEFVEATAVHRFVAVGWTAVEQLDHHDLHLRADAALDDARGQFVLLVDDYGFGPGRFGDLMRPLAPTVNWRPALADSVSTW